MRFLRILPGHGDDSEMAVWGLWFTPDGREMVAATGSSGRVELLHRWDLVRDRPIADALGFEIVSGYDPDVEDYADRPDPTVCPAAGLYAVWGWDVAAETAHLSVSRLRHSVRRTARTAPLPFADDGTRMAFAPDGRHLLLWPVRTPAGSAVWRWPIPADLPATLPVRPRRLDPDPDWRPTAPAEMQAVSVSADGRRLVGGWAGGVGVWDFATGERVAVLHPPQSRKRSPPAAWPIACGPDGSAVAGVIDSTLCLWTVPDPSPVAVAVGPGVECLGFHPGGRRLVAVPRSGPVRLIDGGDGRTITEFDWQIGDRYSLAFSPDGLTAAVGGTDGRVVIWDLDG